MKANKNFHVILQSALFCIITTLTAVANSSTKCDSKIQINTSIDTTNVDGVNIKGAVGDGITDDSLAFQRKLRDCSVRQATCYIPEGVNYLITENLFLWDDACLVGPGTITFDTDKIIEPYLLSIGISGKSMGVIADNKDENVFSGQINDVNFILAESTSPLSQKEREKGRIIFFFRTDGAVVDNNTFEIGSNKYSATSSGNDNKWLSWLPMYIRNNITITNNTLNAQVDLYGSEGIGLAWFTKVLIQNNHINGVGDDPIGIHWCTDVDILDNTLSSTDGRLYVSNSVDVEIGRNIHTRVSDPTGKFHTGIALIWTGFENQSPTKTQHAPTNHYIHDNTLVYNEGAIDIGSALSLRASRGFIVEDNYVYNNSSILSASAMHIWPTEPFSWTVASGITTWDDPDNMDDQGDWSESGLRARVHSIAIRRNTGGGNYPQNIKITGMFAHYVDPINNVIMENNTASSYLNFDIYGINMTTNTNCPTTNGSGYACDSDLDGDGYANGLDNCPDISNPNQSDSDGDAIGNTCDLERVVLTSVASQDGSLLESHEHRNSGGSLEANYGRSIWIGDYIKDRQIKAIVSFSNNLIPANATVKTAHLELAHSETYGDNDPFTTFGSAWADLSIGGFSDNPDLQIIDFEAIATVYKTGQLVVGLVDTVDLDAAGMAQISGASSIQLRIAFDIDDNDDKSPDYVEYYSGDNADSSLHPHLVIDYMLPD